MDDVDLELAFAMERYILGGQLRLECNCILDVLCTMPFTYWVRITHYDHRCPRHPKGGGNHLLLSSEPTWVTSSGEPIVRETFALTFDLLAVRGSVTLMPGSFFDQGRQRHPSMISLEGTHYITCRGNTQKILP